jgi:hypothetical protein
VTPEQIALAIATAVAVGSLAVNAAQGRFNALQGKAKSQRDQKDIEIKGRAQDNADDAAVLAVAKANIDLLKQQNELLIAQNAQIVTQGELREADWRKREEEWHRRERNLEARVDAIDASYKELVVQVQELGVCVKAKECKIFEPAGRRAGAHDTKVGGSD